MGSFFFFGGGGGGGWGSAVQLLDKGNTFLKSIALETMRSWNAETLHQLLDDPFKIISAQFTQPCNLNLPMGGKGSHDLN